MTTTRREASRIARIGLIRASLVRQGPMVAAAFMGAATAVVMQAKDADPEVWDLDAVGDPTERDEVATAFYRDAVKQIEALREQVGEEPDYFYGVVQEAARLALSDLGFKVEIQRHH